MMMHGVCYRHGPDTEIYPQQTNGYDCGAFLCFGALHALHDRTPLFDQSHIPAFRIYIAQQILRAGRDPAC